MNGNGVAGGMTASYTGSNRSIVGARREAELGEAVIVAVVQADQQGVLEGAGIEAQVAARVDGQRVDPLVEREDRSG